MNRLIIHIALLFCGLMTSSAVHAQESIFTGFKSDARKADECYQKKSYGCAIQLYNRLLQKNPGNQEYARRLANSYFLNNDMPNAVIAFDEYEKLKGEFTSEEELSYAMALHSTGNYDKAITRLKKYKNAFPDDVEVSKKIWQLQNIHFLQEDSAYIIIGKLPINSEYDEFGPALHGNTMVFVSNRERVNFIKRMNTDDNKHFFTWFSTTTSSHGENEMQYVSPNHIEPFAKEIKSKHHKGSISFGSEGKTMVYSRTMKNQAKQPATSMLYFGEQIDGKWQETNSYPYNSSAYSIMHPFMSHDGKRLYFSSDMPDGYGGMDLYYSDYENGNWQKPRNLGAVINSSQDEGHPFLRDSVLYFSSNGHPGLGGLDIFQVDLKKLPLEIINQGYPINTYHDDFNLIFDYNGKNGFFCSNRNHIEKTGDDIFSVRFTKLAFPLSVNGKISYKKSELVTADTQLKHLSNAEIELVNKENQETVFTSTTDSYGNFSIEIPYESQFLLRVRQKELGEAIVSMEIPKNHQDYLSHDIVIVQDLFNILQKSKKSTK